jgi:hypothetical protein
MIARTTPFLCTAEDLGETFNAGLQCDSPNYRCFSNGFSTRQPVSPSKLQLLDYENFIRRIFFKNIDQSSHMPPFARKSYHHQ